jgi:phospholipid/cholesterol/gamma-HCH transport system substrate-binding protein
VRAVRGPLVKLVVFVIVSVALTGLVVTTAMNPSFKSQTRYRAVFSDISGLRAGDVVRVAGVEAGTVTDERIVGSLAEVTFNVDNDQPLTTTTMVLVRYQNLLGQRYLGLVAGADPGTPLAADSLIPIERTAPALDLTTLFNGFKPLFAALTPDQVNKLTNLIVQALQGESGAVSTLLGDTAQLTTNLAQRDDVIVQVINHLAGLLSAVDTHDQQLGATIDELHQLVSGLAADRGAIADSLGQIDTLAASLGGLLTSSRPSLDHDIVALRALTDTLVANEDKLGAAVRGVPTLLGTFLRVLDYGSFLNLYVCNLDVAVSGKLAIPVGPLGLPLPVNTPTGPVGDQAQHSAVCR